MSEREAILARVKEGLSVEAPMPGHHGLHATELKDARHSFQQWLPQVGDSFDEQVEAFRTASEALKTDFRLVDDETAAVASLKEISTLEGWEKIANHSHEHVDAAVTALGLESVHDHPWYRVR